MKFILWVVALLCLPSLAYAVPCGGLGCDRGQIQTETSSARIHYEVSISGSSTDTAVTLNTFTQPSGTYTLSSLSTVNWAQTSASAEICYTGTDTVKGRITYSATLFQGTTGTATSIISIGMGENNGTVADGDEISQTVGKQEITQKGDFINVEGEAFVEAVNGDCYAPLLAMDSTGDVVLQRVSASFQVLDGQGNNVIFETNGDFLTAEDGGFLDVSRPRFTSDEFSLQLLNSSAAFNTVVRFRIADAPINTTGNESAGFRLESRLLGSMTERITVTTGGEIEFRGEGPVQSGIKICALTNVGCTTLEIASNVNDVVIGLPADGDGYIMETRLTRHNPCGAAEVLMSSTSPRKKTFDATDPDGCDMALPIAGGVDGDSFCVLDMQESRNATSGIRLTHRLAAATDKFYIQGEAGPEAADAGIETDPALDSYGDYACFEFHDGTWFMKENAGPWIVTVP